jgi:hypothetical protein
MSSTEAGRLKDEKLQRNIIAAKGNQSSLLCRESGTKDATAKSAWEAS